MSRGESDVSEQVWMCERGCGCVRGVVCVCV